MNGAQKQAAYMKEQERRRTHCGGKRIVPMDELGLQKTVRRREPVTKATLPAAVSDLAGRLERLRKALDRLA